MAGRIGKRRNISVSRLKALVSVVDLFNRSPENPSALGVAGGAPWSQVKGTWGTSSGKAISGDSPSVYPLATLTFTKEDVTLSVDGVGPGVGSSFWVSDAGNWWGTVVDGEQSCQTCYNAGTCQQFFNCCNGNTNPVVPGNPFSCCVGSTNPVVPGNFFSCCIGTTNPIVPGNQFSCCVGNTNPSSGGNSFSFTYCSSSSYQNVYFVVNYTCGCNSFCSQGCNSAPGSSCGLTFSQAQACGGCKRCSNSAGGTTVCNSFATGYGTNPIVPGNCNQWGTCTNPSSGGNCNQWGTCQNPSTGGNCNQSGTCYNAATGGNCNAFASNCCYAYNTGNAFSCNCVVNNKVKLIRSIAGTVSSVATFSFNATVAGFKTILSGNTVTVKAYSGSGYQSQIGADQSTTVSGYTKTKKHGILKGPVTYTDAQTSEINEFRVE
jgi:hypothetical protein